jgi:threonine dehydrogenase-like Zn-dependent dehydrogenase
MPDPTGIDALQFRHEIGRYLLSRLTHAYARPLWSAGLAPLHRARLPGPEPPGPGWAVVRTRISGICGSDLSLLTGEDSLYLEPEATYPFVPGHEVVGEIERGLDLPGPLAPGTRVAVWPALGCATRGAGEPCGACAAGWSGLCERRGEAFPGAAFSIGFSRETGGGWSERFLAHHSQLWPLPDAVPDLDAVLLDPAAAALAGLLRTQAASPRNNLVVGGGTIGLLSMELARVLRLPGRWTLLARHPAQVRWAAAREHRVVAPRSSAEFRSWLAGEGAHPIRVAGHGPVFRGVFDRVLVAAGSAQAVRWALDAIAPRGDLALISAPAALPGFDPTAVWYRGVTVHGIHEYGPVPWDGAPRHPYEVMLPLMRAGTLRVGDLVTHRFPLAEHRRAFATALGRADSGAIKVALVPAAPAA